LEDLRRIQHNVARRIPRAAEAGLSRGDTAGDDNDVGWFGGGEGTVIEVPIDLRGWIESNVVFKHETGLMQVGYGVAFGRAGVNPRLLFDRQCFHFGLCVSAVV
jgi:hypothetical protein